MRQIAKELSAPVHLMDCIYTPAPEFRPTDISSENLTASGSCPACKTPGAYTGVTKPNTWSAADGVTLKAWRCRDVGLAGWNICEIIYERNFDHDGANT